MVWFCCSWDSKGCFLFSCIFLLTVMEIKCWYSLEDQQIFHPCSLPYLELCWKVMICNRRGSTIRGLCCASNGERPHVKNRHEVFLERELPTKGLPLLCMAGRWDPSDRRAGVWWKRGHAAPLPLIFQIAHSKYWIKKRKVRLAEERKVSGEEDMKEEMFFLKETLSIPARLQNMGFVYTLWDNFTKSTFTRWKIYPGFFTVIARGTGECILT